MSQMADALYVEHVAADLARADLSPSARQAVDTLCNAANDLAGGRTMLEDRLRAIAADPDLSDTARSRRRDEAVRAWEAATDLYLIDLETRAARLVPHAESQIVPPALHTDPVLAEARGGNARADLQMLLANVPIQGLTDRMAELAQSEAYPHVARLLATSSFGSMYLESRGVSGEEVVTWNERRLTALRPLLTPSAQRVLDDLPALRQASTVPASLRGIFDGQRAAYGPRRN